MNEQNIRELKEQLRSIGFEEGLEFSLRRQICFQPLRFTLHQRVERGGDRLAFQLYYEKTGQGNTYVCKYYDALLSKAIQIPEVLIDEIQTKELEKQMASIDWGVAANTGNTAAIHANPVDGQREEEIENIVTSLFTLERNEEGKPIAQLLKLKYWWGTPAERYMENSSSLKSQYETTQRFYFLHGAEVITIEEAYRFLSNKWMEKRLYARRKESTVEQQKASTANKSTGASTGKVKKAGPGRIGK